MPSALKATFATRRDAEMAVEHIIQEHGVDAGAINVFADREENTAGVEAAGSDLEDGHVKRDAAGEPALAGRIRVVVSGNEALASEIRSSFATYGGQDVAT